MSRFAGRTVAITGAARGLGAAYARGFADEGAAVVLIDHDAAVDLVAVETGGVAHFCAGDGIRVNAIAPGLIADEAQAAGLPDAHAAHVRDGRLLDRTGTAADIVALAMFLASDAARFITGEVVSCDGGSHRRHWRY